MMFRQMPYRLEKEQRYFYLTNEEQHYYGDNLRKIAELKRKAILLRAYSQQSTEVKSDEDLLPSNQANLIKQIADWMDELGDSIKDMQHYKMNRSENQYLAYNTVLEVALKVVDSNSVEDFQRNLQALNRLCMDERNNLKAGHQKLDQRAYRAIAGLETVLYSVLAVGFVALSPPLMFVGGGISLLAVLGYVGAAMSLFIAAANGVDGVATRNEINMPVFPSDTIKKERTDAILGSGAQEAVVQVNRPRM